ncbi:MAG: NAD-binding protein [Streptosporangiaceae bacterium]|nr:NAD-binding protein [Streptosporangiaceae bacterium]MBV9853705.1 NAD-binding protein [Streptosporangiaceae bacterium]
MGGAYGTWHGHVIVCGLRGVGLRIVEQLTLSGVPALVVEDTPDPPLARVIEGWGVPLIAGNSRAAETLAGAGLAGAAAVICAQHDDLHTLETALLTRRLREDVRVVVQLANPAVGRALKQAGFSVLDVAGLSAPSIVEACTRAGAQEMTLSGQRFLAARSTSPKAASLRELYGALAPVAVVPAAGGDVAICPGRDARVKAGDQVTLIGTPDELRAASVFEYSERTVPSPQTNRSRRGGRRRGVFHLAMVLLHAADRRLAIALGALVAVLIASTVVLRLAYEYAGAQHISLLDAAYFTVETVTTVGYGDYTFRGQSPWLMAFAISLMLAGALFVAVFFALVTNVLVSRRIEESLGRRQITGLTGHILVIGLGTVGLRVVQQLAAAGSDVVVVEKDERGRHLEQVRALGVPVVIADATLPEVLRSVRLSAASAVAVLTSDDLANLETGLAVRDQLGARWETTPVVLRIFDPQLAHSVKETFGFTDVRSTAALAAPWFVGAALGLDVLSTFYAGDEPLLVARLTVTPDGGLHGLTMRDLAARTRVLAIRRAADRATLEHPPRRSTRFRPADEAYLIGPYSELLTVLRRDRPTPQPAAAPSQPPVSSPPPPPPATPLSRPPRAPGSRCREGCGGRGWPVWVRSVLLSQRGSHPNPPAGALARVPPVLHS